MKNLLLILTVSCTYLSNAQTPALDRFYRTHKKVDDVAHISLGGFILKIGSWFIEDPTARTLARKAKRARFLVTEGENRIRNAEVNKLVRQLRRDNFESLVQIRDHGDKIDLFIREDGRYIRNVLATVRSDDEFILASFECKLKKSDMEDLLNDVL